MGTVGLNSISQHDVSCLIARLCELEEQYVRAHERVNDVSRIHSLEGPHMMQVW